MARGKVNLGKEKNTCKGRKHMSANDLLSSPLSRGAAVSGTGKAGKDQSLRTMPC